MLKRSYLIILILLFSLPYNVLFAEPKVKQVLEKQKKSPKVLKKKQRKDKIGEVFSYNTLRGYARSERANIVNNYIFDFTYGAVGVTASSLGLFRYSKHQDEINVIYALNLIMHGLHFYRTLSIVREKGIFWTPYLETRKIKDLKLRERVAEYRMMEVANSSRQIRRITSMFSLISAGLIAAFAEGKTPELISAAFLAGNSIFYQFFYESYGEDAYDKYFFFKKAYPELTVKKDFLKLSLNFIF